MRIRSLLLLLTAATLVLAGCVSPDPVPSASSSAAVEPSPTSSPTPEAAPQLVLSVDSITYEHDGAAEVVPLDEGAALVALLEGIAGAGTQEEFDGPYDSEGGTRYRWEGIVVSIWAFDAAADVSVDGATVGGVPIATTEGVAVGATRADAIAAGAFEICTYDGDGDGLTDSLALQATEVADTQSLCRSGSVGIEFVDVGFTGDTVTRLSAPGNDFSDI